MGTIAVDAMGGDDGPETMVAGAARASLDTPANIILVGDRGQIESLLEKNTHDQRRIQVVHSDSVIPMDAKPRAALIELPEASLPMAASLVGKDGPADALVSAGNTGAVVLASANAFSRIDGIKRTALAAVVPTKRNRGPHSDPFSLVLDVGATIRVSAQDLVCFAAMGAAYASIISKNENPRVALLSNGAEANKGTPEIVEAHEILLAQTMINFIGNVEGIDLPKGVADVVVCDGFTGNVVLKMLEGVSEAVMDLAKYAYRSRLTWKLAFLLLANGIRRVKKITDWQQYGGAPILGFDQLCIKAHGRSSPRAIRNAIRVAEKCVSQDLANVIKNQLDTSN
jgi:glycerol-3-phosphate acyltransferase PlsX